MVTIETMEMTEPDTVFFLLLFFLGPGIRHWRRLQSWYLLAPPPWHARLPGQQPEQGRGLSAAGVS